MFYSLCIMTQILYRYTDVDSLKGFFNGSLDGYRIHLE